MERKIVSRIMLTLLLITMLSISAPVPTPASPTPSLPEKIYIGAALCLTGPWKGPAADYSLAIEDYWTLVNERGGINGIPVELLVADNQYDPDTTLTIVTGWMAEYNLSVVLTCGIHVVAALYPTMEDAKIPFTDISMFEVWANASKYPYYFLPPFSSYTDHYRAFLKWFKNSWTEARAPKLAIIWETKAFGWMVKPGVASYAADIGYEIHEEVVEIGSVDVTPQLTRIKDWRADVIATIEAPAETGLILSTAAAMGIDAEFINYYYAFFWEPLIEIYGDIAEGKYVGGNLVPYGYDVPGMANITAANDRFHPGETRNCMYVLGWVHSMIIEEALKRAAEAGDLSGEGVKKAWETINDFDTGGLTPPVTYTSTDHRGTTTVWIWKVEGGQFVRVDEITLPRVIEPVAIFTYSPEFPLVNETVTFNASASYDPDGTIVSYKWDFEDGNVTTVTEPTITHVYTALGAYNVTLTVTDNATLTDTTWDIVKVGYPVAVFTYSPPTPLVNQTVIFDASASYDPDGDIVSYFWDFGDDTFGTGVIVTHAYTAAGAYNVTLTVTDNDGLTGTTSKAITVKEGPPPPLSIYTDKYTYSAGDTMYLGLDIYNPYHWPITVCIAVWLEKPDSSIIPILHAHAVTLPPRFTYSNPIFKTFVLPSIQPGVYTWHVAFLYPTTHTIMMEDTAEWQFV